MIQGAQRGSNERLTKSLRFTFRVERQDPKRLNGGHFEKGSRSGIFLDNPEFSFLFSHHRSLTWEDSWTCLSLISGLLHRARLQAQAMPPPQTTTYAGLTIQRYTFSPYTRALHNAPHGAMVGTCANWLGRLPIAGGKHATNSPLPQLTHALCCCLLL